MPGTVVRDALAPNLLAANTLTTAGGTTTGTAWEALWPGLVQFTVAVASVTGTTPTCRINIQGSESPTFAAGTVVSYGSIQLAAEAANSSFGLTTHVDSRYVRLQTIVAGTTAVYTATATPVLPHDRRVRSKAPTAAVIV